VTYNSIYLLGIPHEELKLHILNQDRSSNSLTLNPSKNKTTRTQANERVNSSKSFSLRNQP